MGSGGAWGEREPPSSRGSSRAAPRWPPRPRPQPREGRAGGGGRRRHGVSGSLGGRVRDARYRACLCPPPHRRPVPVDDQRDRSWRRTRPWPQGDTTGCGHENGGSWALTARAGPSRPAMVPSRPRPEAARPPGPAPPEEPGWETRCSRGSARWTPRTGKRRRSRFRCRSGSCRLTRIGGARRSHWPDRTSPEEPPEAAAVPWWAVAAERW